MDKTYFHGSLFMDWKSVRVRFSNNSPKIMVITLNSLVITQTGNLLSHKPGLVQKLWLSLTVTVDTFTFFHFNFNLSEQAAKLNKFLSIPFIFLAACLIPGFDDNFCIYLSINTKLCLRTGDSSGRISCPLAITIICTNTGCRTVHNTYPGIYFNKRAHKS